MKFFEWTTDYDSYNACHGKNADPYPEFRSWRIPQLQRNGVWPIRLISEDGWQADGRPYYNVHPELVAKLAKVNLAKIPSDLIELPKPFKTINIRFAQQHPELTLTEACKAGGHPLSQQVPAGSFVHSLLFADMRSSEGKSEAVSIAAILEFGIQTDFGNNQHLPTYGIFPLVTNPGVSLADAIEESASIVKKMNPSYEQLVRNCLSLAVTIGFLANSSSELIEYDVLSKFRREFDDGDETRKKAIIDKSRRRGKIGWNVGNDLMFLGSMPPMGGSHAGPGDRELSWAHIRTGHPHAVRYGPGKTHVKIMWFSPTVVRADLPFKKDD